MNIFSKFTVAAVVAASSILSAAEVIDMTAKDFWHPQRQVKFADGTMSHTGRVMLRSKQKFAIDPAKKYTFEIDVDAADGAKRTTFLYGFYPCNEKGAAYNAYHIQSIPATLTQVVADAKKGDTELKVKNASKWSKATYCTIALNAKADCSDIPNRAIIPIAVASTKNNGSDWTITLKKPLTQNIAAGTTIRQHVSGGYNYLYSGAIDPTKSIKTQRSITGTASHGSYSGKAFHPAIKHAYIVILSDWINTKLPLTIKKATLTIE